MASPAAERQRQLCPEGRIGCRLGETEQHAGLKGQRALLPSLELEGDEWTDPVPDVPTAAADVGIPAEALHPDQEAFAHLVRELPAIEESGAFLVLAERGL